METSGLVFDVQRFSVDDGPGIRTTVFLKGCPLRCAWCQNPESLRPEPELDFDLGRCRSWGGCVAACPRGALGPDGARLSRERCDACGMCVPACPQGALRVVGRRVGVAELLEEVLRDAPFYAASGGGVTLSGGEPTLQMGFLGEFAGACRARGLGVGFQTCGAFRREALAPHLALFEFIHFDLKLMDAARHRALTGGDNRAILDNARWLASCGAPLLFRMPIVPGYTDGEDNLSQIAGFLRELGVSRIHLLRYHALGEAKLNRLGFPLQPLGIPQADRGPERTERAAVRLRLEGLEVRL